MRLSRSFTLALTVVALTTVAYAAKNPIVGGKEMFPNKNIIENAVNSADHIYERAPQVKLGARHTSSERARPAYPAIRARAANGCPQPARSLAHHHVPRTHDNRSHIYPSSRELSVSLDRVGRHSRSRA
jgi:hypothetical protein